MRALRISLRVLAVVAALAVLGLLGLLWLLGTEPGTRWLVARALPYAEPYVQVAGETSGTLLETLVLRDVELDLPGHEVSTPRLSVSLELAPLLAATLHVRRLELATVRYRQVPGEAASAEPDAADGPIDLPIDIVVDDLVVAGLEADLGERVEQVGRTEASLSFIGSSLDVRDLSTSAAGFELAGRAAVVLVEPLELDVALDWSGSYEDRELAGRLEARGPLTGLDVSHALRRPFEMTTAGSVTVGDEIGFDVRTQWNDAAVEGFELVRSPSGSLEVSGTLGQFAFSGQSRVVVTRPGGEPRDVEVELTGAREGTVVRVMPLTLSAALGRVEASGRYDIEAQSFEADVAARSLDPAGEWPEWPADLDADASVSGRLAPEIEVVVDGLGVNGELRGRPLALSGELAYTASTGLSTRELTLQSGPSRVIVDGRFGERIDARLEASIDELSSWVPELEGALRADVALAGTRASPRVSGRVVASSIAYETLAVERLSFEGDVGIELDAPFEAVVEAQGLSRGALEIDSIRTELTGTARDHAIALDVAAPQWTALGRAAGGLEDRIWQGSVSRLELDQQTLGLWQLREQVELVLGPGNYSVERTCLLQGETRVCGALSLTGADDDALTLQATDFDLRALEPLLPPDLEVQGIYQLDARLESLSTTPRGSLTLDGAPTTIGIALSETESAETVIEQVGLDVRLEDWAMAVRAGFSGRQTGEASLELDVDDIRAESSPVTGSISVGWQDLAPLSLLTPAVGRIGGSVSVDLGLGGTLEEPSVDGRAELVDGTITVPAWGTDLEAIRVTATSRDGRRLDIEASGRAGEGTLTLEATTELDPDAGWPTRGVVRGERIRAVQLPEAEVLVSPNLNVLVVGPRVQVSGTVTVPSADIRIEQLPQAAVTPSADAVVHGTTEAEAPAEPRALDVAADMTLVLGDDVSYEGSGLAADLAGELRLQYRSGEPETATGTLTLDGEYTAYGQTLDLETGRLVFTGPLDNPRLDVRAQRRIDDAILVGVQLTGPLQSPRTMIFSMPAMGEADALSYLLFGRPLENAGESADSAALRSAALSMGLQQALPVVERIGQSLGLDELTVASTEIDSGALMAGKQISPNLYMRYSYGLFNRIGGLLLRFRINERLSLETRSGDEDSMDLLYTVEKD